ncbi:hemin uptake protein HemP [Sulfitobacter sp. D35]|uniref:hemin uptake protein HemP n=1 Tax=Sulfitobacter sp. D35 TaxID=3083252 RepID=UPI00296E30D5|nr:hemin uptake protein HemP [Sulfitobacter sp. D35]MDW4498442.1 hemin uptake protein HemP [Sulfitobacter sp. D35]
MPDGSRSESGSNSCQQIPLFDARLMTSGGNLAQIVLDGQTYTLRITRAGKLILTK